MAEEKSKPNYYAIIPANVRYDIRLSSTAKLIYGEITALCNKEGFCWASNKYFSDIYNLSVRQIQSTLHLLRDCGYVTIEYINEEVSNSTKRQIYMVKKTLPTNEENLISTYEENFTPIIQDINKEHISHNFEPSKEQKDSKPFCKEHKSLSKQQEAIERITIADKSILLLNELTKHQFKLTHNNRKLIVKLLKQGHTELEIESVIRYKHKQWWGTDFRLYLRPTTLFGDKFESYLFESKNIPPKQSHGTGHISL